MHSKDNANADLVLETLPSGESAWLRPACPIDRYRLTERAIIVDQSESEGVAMVRMSCALSLMTLR
jgi:hypothetical protein